MLSRPSTPSLLTEPNGVSPLQRHAALPGWRGNEPLTGKADAALGKLHDKSPGLSQMLSDVPLRQTLASFDGHHLYGAYQQFKPQLRKLRSELVARYGEPLTLQYGLALLATSIADHEKKWRETGLDPDLEPNFVDSFHRILTAVTRGGTRSLMPDTDAFAKELAICLYRVIPAGAQLIDAGGAFPRRFLIRRPIRESIAVGRHVLFKAGGFAPYALLHTSLFQRHWFTPEGFEYTFRCLPAVFRSWPALKGVIGSSWFLDPALRDISPELVFVRQIAQRWGAMHLYVRPDPSPDSDAFLFSSKRRELFQAGQYVPQVHMFVIAKRDILAHAETTSVPPSPSGNRS